MTVAEGLVEATALDLLSDRGLIGTEVVEDPRTCGRGAALTTPEAAGETAVDDDDDPEGGITLTTGFTCPTAGGFCPCCCGVAEPVGGCCCWLLLLERWKTEAVAGGVETALALLYGVAAVVHLVFVDELVALLNGKAVDGLEVALTAEVGGAAVAEAEAAADAAAAAAVVVADLVDCANAGALCGSFLISTTGLKGLTEVAGD